MTRSLTALERLSDLDGVLEAEPDALWLRSDSDYDPILVAAAVGMPARVDATSLGHPAVIAKSLASLDRFLDGTLEVSLDAGTDPEVAGVFRAVWAGEAFAGRSFKVDAGVANPRPQHRVPIWARVTYDRDIKAARAWADGWMLTRVDQRDLVSGSLCLHGDPVLADRLGFDEAIVG